MNYKITVKDIVSTCDNEQWFVFHYLNQNDLFLVQLRVLRGYAIQKFFVDDVCLLDYNVYSFFVANKEIHIIIEV